MMKHKHSRRDFLSKMAGLGCASLGLSPILSSITNLHAMNAAAFANKPIYSNQSNYKALVCIMLSGGNDSFNMLVPRDDMGYGQYNTVRENMALNQADLLPINPDSVDSNGYEFGLHPKLTNIQNLFENKKAAFIANVGTLVEPTSLSSFNNNQNLPLGLFSHSDQRMHWQTSLPQDSSGLGWGGRLADIISLNNNNQSVSMNISLGGVNVFQQGNTLREFVISGENVTGIKDHELGNSVINNLKFEAMDSLVNQNYQNILSTAYADIYKKGTGGATQFGNALNQVNTNVLVNGEFLTTFPNTSLGTNLKTIAKTIAARDILDVNYQTFFINMKGFDTHNNLLGNHANLLDDFDKAIAAFHATMEELGLQDNVVSFTVSDFARKLISNGDGTDHGWGGNMLVIGGENAINGQKIYGDYVDLSGGSAQEITYSDGQRAGVFIPTTSCDEYFAELALWFGASSSDLNQILPNINNFWTPNSTGGPIGFMK